ncbi:MAG: response regulator [Calditrichota bacterium]
MVSNAGEAIAEGSGKKVFVKTEQTYCDGYCKQSLFLTPGFKAGNYVKISVIDQGCGIFPDTLKLIFDPFFSTRFIGRGLGLPTVLGIVRSHNGGVSVESTPEVGSTFHVMLPLPEGEPISIHAEEEHENDWSGGGTIMVVDDEAIVRNLFSRILRRNGFDVVTASSGEEAVDLFQERPQLYSLLILDMTMPGIDGLETFQRMKALHPDINAVICSGYSEVGLSENPKTRGISAFIKKPFNIDDVTNTLKRVLSA